MVKKKKKLAKASCGITNFTIYYTYTYAYTHKNVYEHF